uniref:Lipase_3 domain-containing protein n=1 Tax=Parastrongyloides trichosuri TaxID=131310 RepID=A0A0N4ZK33_PARTI
MFLRFLFLLSVIIFQYINSSEFTQEYSHEEVQILGRVSSLIYSNFINDCYKVDKELQKHINILVNDYVVDFIRLGVFRYMILEFKTQPGTIIVVSKGTGNQAQLFGQWVNLNFFRKQLYYNAGKVWEYQLTAHNLYIDDLLEKIDKLLKNKKYKNVIFTGHSLGGSLSVLHAFDCVYKNICSRNETKVVTLGGPRTGDIEFAKSFNELIPNTYRVVNRKDPINDFPNCKAYSYMVSCRTEDLTSIDDFYHVGTEVWYYGGTTGPNRNEYVICKKHVEDSQCSKKARLTELSLIQEQQYFEKWHLEYFVNKSTSFDIDTILCGYE